MAVCVSAAPRRWWSRLGGAVDPVTTRSLRPRSSPTIPTSSTQGCSSSTPMVTTLTSSAQDEHARRGAACGLLRVRPVDGFGRRGGHPTPPLDLLARPRLPPSAVLHEHRRLAAFEVDAWESGCRPCPRKSDLVGQWRTSTSASFGPADRERPRGRAARTRTAVVTSPRRVPWRFTPRPIRYPSRVAATVRSQVKVATLDRRGQRRDRFAVREDVGKCTSERVDVVGSTRRAASPTTSGMAPARAATTGHPCAMASSGGSPNPSKRDGYTRTGRRAGRSGRGHRRRRPTKRIRSVRPPSGDRLVILRGRGGRSTPGGPPDRVPPPRPARRSSSCTALSLAHVEHPRVLGEGQGTRFGVHDADPERCDLTIFGGKAEAIEEILRRVVCEIVKTMSAASHQGRFDSASRLADRTARVTARGSCRTR